MKILKRLKSLLKRSRILNKLSFQKTKEKNNHFITNYESGIQSDSDRNKGPWTKIETWKMVKRNLTGHQIRSILGNPNKIKGNLSPRIDQVYHYLGDLDADGTEETALVNFLSGSCGIIQITILIITDIFRFFSDNSRLDKFFKFINIYNLFYSL